MADLELPDGLRDDLRAAWHRYVDLLAPLRPTLHGYCRRLTGNLWDAEDLVQDTLLRAFGTLGSVFTRVEETETAADGLGPVFNNTSCVACHSAGGTGGGSEIVETRFGTVTHKAFDPLTALGGSLIQTDGIGVAGACTFVGEVVPPQATIVAGRRTTPLFGLGLVDAVPDATFVAHAQKAARRQPEIAGRPNMVTDVTTGGSAVGKFGWKSQVPNLLQFSGDAYLNEMGITTPMFPDENCPQGNCALLACDPVPGVDDDLEDVELFHDFMRFLAPPPRPGAASGKLAASRLFEQVGCAGCHVPELSSFSIAPSPESPVTRADAMVTARGRADPSSDAPMVQ